MGRVFATQAIRAATYGRLGFREAYGLTGLRGGTFQKYAARLWSRTAMGGPIHLIDADVFISARNSYYAFDICPGF